MEFPDKANLFALGIYPEVTDGNKSKSISVKLI